MEGFKATNAQLFKALKNPSTREKWPFFSKLWPGTEKNQFGQCKTFSVISFATTPPPAWVFKNSGSLVLYNWFTLFVAYMF